MNNHFNEKRRQQFLTESYYLNCLNYYKEERDYWKEHLQGVGDTDEENRSLARSTYAEYSYVVFSLRYTAGVAIENLRTELTEVIEAYECYQKALADYEEIPKVSPIRFRVPDDYERAMQLIGLCYLLHRRDLLPRLAALLDPAYKGKDAFYEEFLDYELDDREVDCEEMFHGYYNHILDAMYGETEAERIAVVNKHLLGWYPFFKYAPWHDGHLRINGDEGDYFGYWAFEAGAVAYLCDIDDSGIDHMVYPKDLVAWARQHKTLSEADDDGMVPLRCEANHPCPQTGIWSTPANPDARRPFKAGDPMPDFPNSTYGKTIWYWDDNQNE